MRVHSELPIFRLNRGARTGLYAPGLLVVARRDQADRILTGLSAALPDEPPSPPRATASRLEQQARVGLDAWDALCRRRFSPACLALYLSNRCNLACGYCFSAPWPLAPRPSPGHRARTVTLQLGPIGDAARDTAASCARSGQPFFLSIQGGGEPSLHGELLRHIVALTQAIASAAGVEWRSHLSTNGVMSTHRARWISDAIHHIGLSCDGPPDIHDRQRPLAGGGSSSQFVRRSAAQFRRYAQGYSIRATITDDSAARQTEIVTYLADTLGCRDLRFEPLYLPGRSRLRPPHPLRFIDGFFAARERADALGCTLKLSGVRMNEIHGPYCNRLREVLLLMPDGRASDCFAGGRTASVGSHGTVAAVCQEAALPHRALTVPPPCRDCINCLHCARDCPDVCYAEAPAAVGGTRCKILRAYAERRLNALIDAHRAAEPRCIWLTD
jgi:sulfatase maturation enzyme AslB (radical SAM superfamily)